MSGNSGGVGATGPTGGTASLSAYSTTAQDAAIYLTQTAAVATYQTKLSFGDPTYGNSSPNAGVCLLVPDLNWAQASCFPR